MSAAQLVPVNFCLLVNVPESRLVENIRVNKERKLPYVTAAPERERGLVIVGSGPSLAWTWKTIPPDCDVMALNGAYQFLLERGISPKYAVCLDAKPENVNFFERTSPETYHLLASQCDPAVYEHIAANGGQLATFHLHAGSLRDVYADGEVTEISAFQTVGLTALTLAACLGYRKLHLLGYDSSYDEGVSHVRHQPQNDTHGTVDIEFKGKWYTTTHAMASQVARYFWLHKMLHEQYPGMEINVLGTGLFYDFVRAAPEGSSRETEVAKYADLYDWEHYGMSQFRRDEIQKILLGLHRGDEPKSLVDVGTGRGETIELASRIGFTPVMGTETAKQLLNDDVVEAILPKLPFPDKSFDVVTNFEVIEHLYPFDVVPSLKEMARVARRHVIVSACTIPSIVGGVELHPSARPYDAWVATIREAIPGAHIEYLTNMSDMEGVSPCWRIDL